MGLVEDSINDAAEFTANTDDFGELAELIAPTGEVAAVAGYNTKVMIKEYNPSIDQYVNSKKAAFVVHERNILVVNPNYPVRISDPADKFYREVRMIEHKVNVKDVSGVIKNYVCSENLADEQIGLITLILQDLQT